MKLTSNFPKFLCAAFILTGAASTASAHDYWVNAQNGELGKVLKVETGYGHEFSKAEAIPSDRADIFNPASLLSKDGEIALKKGAENFDFYTEAPVSKGTYIAVATYKPTFWSEDADGKWLIKSKKEMPDARQCELAARWAKSIVNIGGASDDYVTKPLGHTLELVPLKNPSEIKVGEVFTLQLLLNGRPRIGAKVYGTFEGFNADPSAKAFFGVTNEKGQIPFIALKKGYWHVFAETTRPYSDTAVCDKELLDASLTFNVE